MKHKLLIVLNGLLFGTAVLGWLNWWKVKQERDELVSELVSYGVEAEWKVNFPEKQEDSIKEL